MDSLICGSGTDNLGLVARESKKALVKLMLASYHDNSAAEQKATCEPG